MSLFESLDDLHDENNTLDINVSLPVMQYDLESLYKNIENGSFSDFKIQSVIKCNLSNLLDYNNFEKVDSRKFMQGLWTSKRFLNAFLAIISSDMTTMDIILTSYRRELNKLIFDYVFINTTKDPEIESLYIMLAKIINAKDIIPLTTILPRDLSWQLCVCKYSSFKLDLCVHNLNFAIINSDLDISIKNIIYIYSRFYADDFTTLFCASMIDIYDPESDMAKKLNDRITIALLSILNSMTSVDIELTLTRYANYLSFNKEAVLRCQIRGLSEDYSRINKIVDSLGNQGIYVP